MKLTTWNCRRGSLDEKLAALASTDADILVLTEASRPSHQDHAAVWFGEGKLGVAVVARPPFRIESVEQRDVPCVYPVQVSGPENFTLFAVWTWPAPSYARALANGLEAYSDFPKPWVVAGDFNVCFDPKHTRKISTQCLARLHSEGLVSAYHAYSGDLHGQENSATHYFLTHRDRPFHIDYCFIPAAWSNRLESVTVASFEDYSSLSDHRPLSLSLRTS